MGRVKASRVNSGRARTRARAVARRDGEVFVPAPYGGQTRGEVAANKLIKQLRAKFGPKG